MSPPALRRYRAERLLRKEFPALRAKVLAVVRSQLRGKGVSLDPSDLEACYAQAWQGLYADVLAGEEVENPSAWLVLVTFRRAIDEARSADRRHAGGQSRSTASDLEVAIESGRAVSDPDFAAALDDSARLRHVFEGLRNRLSARECEAASLCYLQGLSRSEAAERMGIGEARMRKLMEGAGPGRPGVAGRVGELLDTIEAGGWCEQQSSLVRAYAFGVLDPAGERHALAVAHCRECPACRAHVVSLRGLAAVLPPLPLWLVLGGGAGAAAGTGTSTAASGGATGTGWSGVVGSLTAKLAVTGLVVALGAGYAVLGSRAHGSPAARHANAPTSPPATGAFPQTLFATPSVPVRRGGSRSRSATARLSHRQSSPGGRVAGEPAAREFGPERVRGEARAVASPPPTAARSQGNTAATGGEFGFE